MPAGDPTLTERSRWTVTNAIDAIYSRPLLRGLTILIAHLVPVPIANYLAFWLRFDGGIPREFQARFIDLLPSLLALRAAAFLASRLHYGLWRYASISDLRSIVTAVTLSSLAFYVIVSLLLGVPYPRSVVVIDSLLLIVILGGLRMTRRLVRELQTGRGRRVLVIGAGDAGEMIVREMIFSGADHYRPVGFLDDNPSKVGRRIHGVPVLGTVDLVAAAIETAKPEEFLIAIPSAEPSLIRVIVRKLETHKLPIKTLPRLRDVIDGRVNVQQIRSLAVEDLLSRAPVGLDPAPLEGLIAGKRVMVTGAGGSIGSELCRQIATFMPASLVLFDRYENGLHAIRLELADKASQGQLHAVVGDVSDVASVSSAMERHKPHIVFHAAAHKHVPLMEENPCEAIKNNVRGTRVLARASDQYGVDRFILISTDKAVNPTSVMGASKRIAELVVQAQATASATSFAAVRFGNVLGSNGSVVPRFLDQIRRGGPVTVTHPEMRRFFMLIPEAVQLVLHAAAQWSRTGAIYVLEMGEQVRLVDLARDMVRLSGVTADQEIPIVFTGLRPGEKLFEELVGKDEQVMPAGVKKLLCVTSRTAPDQTLWASLADLEAKADRGDAKGVLASIRSLLPDYLPSDAPVPDALAPDEAPPAVSRDSADAAAQPQRCPECGQPVQRSRTRSMFERARKERSARRPYRCACGWRGWLVPLYAPDLTAIEPQPAPELDQLDELAPESAKTPFSPRQLR